MILAANDVLPQRTWHLGPIGEDITVSTYVCMDGPLAGRSFRWRRLPLLSRPVKVALVDVGHGVLEVEYVVQRAADRTRPGDLRFVEARDVWRKPGWRERARRSVAL